MGDILGYFGDKQGKPIAYMRNSGLILFSNKKELVKYNYLGDFNFLNRVIISGNRDVFSKKKKQQATSRLHKQRAGGGLFGESQGSCGWGNNPSCCFTSCAPLWRTSLWPFSDATM
jgi:hypothetical protein